MPILIAFFQQNIIFIYFLYGLAFFSMGLIVMLEASQQSEMRLARALRPLALFGLMHGVHEWGEMFQLILALNTGYVPSADQEALRLVWLAVSFDALAVFGLLLIVPGSQTGEARRSWPVLAWAVPLVLTLLWLAGVPLLRAAGGDTNAWLDASDVWARYPLGIPAGLLACWGLVQQQHLFRAEGMVKFSRDSLWAAVAFGWYGVVGQVFTRPSYLFPSTFLNSDLFLLAFGIPVQLFRATVALIASVFVVRSLRAFEVERNRRLEGLRQAQLREAEAREQLNADLLRQIVNAQEAERQRIARELHDETGQALTGLGLGLRSLRSTLTQDPARAGRNAQELEALAAQALDELRRLVGDLRPAQLDDLGLVAALRWYAKEVEERAGLLVTLELPAGRLALPAELNTVLFRIAQEALTNVVRHAHARSVSVRLTMSDRDVRLSVADDGEGFRPEAALAPGTGRRAWGLVGMQERAALLGGQFQVSSAPGQGAEVFVVVPLENHSHG